MSILETLGIKELNSGACFGPDGWINTKNNGNIISTNPTNNQEIASVNNCNIEDYKLVVNKSLEAQKEWSKVPAPERGQLVRRMGNALRDYKDPLGSLVSLEMGKIKQEGDGEVQEMIDIADFAVGQSRMLYGKTMHSERVEHRMYEQWHPVGIVGVISAFNFPVAVWSWNAFIAAICGNSTIWKPSPSTPLCAIAVQNICNEVLSASNMPSIFSTVIGPGSVIGEEMINDKNISLVSFTGSTKVGRHVNEMVSKRFGKVILELGGNNCIIVDESADMNLVIPAIVFGAVGTAGQRCTSTRRVLVHHSKYNELKTKLISAYKQVNIGDPLDPDTLMGPLVDAAAIDNFEKAITRAKKLGGEVIYGGDKLNLEGNFINPTIIKAENDWKVVQEETFASILYLMTFEKLKDAIFFTK